MEVKQASCTLYLHDDTGDIVSLQHEGRVLFEQEGLALFALGLRDQDGHALTLSSHDKEALRWTTQEETGERTLHLHFARIGHLSLDAEVIVRLPREGTLTYWRIQLANQTAYTLEWIDFPQVSVANDLVGAGGSSRLLWPGCEGLLVEDMQMRERTWISYKPVQYRNRGWEGLYPGCCTSQCMAYYNEHDGLYLAAHDGDAQLKAIEFFLQDDRVHLQYRLFLGALGQGTWRMEYEMVLGVFQGDWHDAAAIYRDWYETVHPATPVTDRLPAWYLQAPVIVGYPVRGKKDTGEMEPNVYYPYEHALPYLDRLADALKTQLMALLMHWEGTAPWAPPYIWPPFGGEALLERFIEQMHARGHFVGLYASGIGWTEESLLVDYNRHEQFEQEDLARFMCRGPQGELPYSLICGGAQRWGYDICAATPFAREVVQHEITQVAATGCDYLQFFDQQIGGTPYFCHAHDHGHPPAPGRWMVESMQQIYATARDAAGNHLVLGCEAAAAEPYQEALPVNDLRSHMGLNVGKPVPLYAFLYHGRLANFMGNQVSISSIIDVAQSPLLAQQQIAMAFVAGDLLSVILNGQGEMHWGWGSSWEDAPPEQAPLAELISTLCAWRTQAAREWLVAGRMLKPHPLREPQQVHLMRVDGFSISYPAVATSRWQAHDGRIAQICVNYTNEPQQMELDFLPESIEEVLVLDTPQGEGETLHHASAGRFSRQLAPRTVLLLIERPAAR